MGGYNTNNVNFDDQFDPDVQGDGPTASNYKVAGVPAKYADIKHGTKGPDCGYKEAGVDLSNKWAKKGSAVYALPIDGGNFVARSDGQISAAMDAKITFALNADGTYTLTCVGNTPDTTAGAAGSWLPDGQSAADYQVEFVWSQTSQSTSGPATVTNGAAAYQACTANRSILIEAQVGQFSASDKGSKATVTVNLKRISTGVITVTNFAVWVESFGSG